MQTGFSIDDVRETLTRDVTRSLGRIESAARDVLDDPALVADGEPAGFARLASVADHSHAICGTSRLVAARSLADSASRMEELAHRGRDQLSRALSHLSAVREIAAAMVGGSTDMLAMLSLELDGKPGEALEIAESWRLRVDDVLQKNARLTAAAGSAASGPQGIEEPDEVAAPGSSSASPDAARAVDDGWDAFDDGPAAPPALPEIPPPPTAGYSFETSIIEVSAADPALDPDLAEVFADEARATLDALDASLAAFAASLDNRELLYQIERGFHTLKGAAATVGLAEVSQRAAALHDRAEALLDAGQSLAAADLAGLVDGAAVLRKLAGLVGRDRVEPPAAVIPPPPPPPVRAATPAVAEGARRVTVPVPDAELDPSFQQECAELLEGLDRNALALEKSEQPVADLGELLRGYHTLKGVVNALGLQSIGDQLHELEDLLESLAGSAILPPPPAIAGLLLPFHGELRRQLRTVRHGYVDMVPGRLAGRIARLLAGASRAGSASVMHTTTGSVRLPSGRSRNPVSRLGEGSEAGHTGASAAPDRRNLRVEIERLDALMNLAGELVINRSRLLSRIDWLRGLQVDLGRSTRRVIDIVEKFRDDHEFSTLARAGKDRAARWSGFSDLELDRYEDVNILARSLTEGSTDLQELFGQFAGGLGSLADDSETLGAIVSGIQGEVTRTRMVPLEVLFSRLQLPLRDAAQRAGRDVRMEMIGADVRLDKAIADALFQPMLHLVRNAVSHGIEAPDVRTSAGKPAHGTVTLRARQELGHIVVEVVDDGGGLDLERLRERGAALGLVAHDTPLGDARIRDLIFVHGLSTHGAADAVAGRGVGCDVVRRAIDRLGGLLQVDSLRGQHTRFAITLPVTLAISRVLLVRHAGDTFAVPLAFIERIIDVREIELVESANQRRIEIDGEYLPVRPFGDFVSGPSSNTGPILLLQVGGQRVAVQADEVLTQEEIVVKGLGALLRGHPMFAGVTIRGNGETVLIVDIPGLIDAAIGRNAVRPEPVRPRAAAAPAALPAAAAPVVPAAPDRPLQVLFVDDSVSVRKVAERALRLLGVEVTLASDGVDALDKLRADQFDLVFTDLEMPRMHGYELIRELRFLPAYHTLPVVVVTSRSGKKHRDEAYAVGATEYLTKPFTARGLAATLVKFCGPRAQRLAVDAAAAEVSP